LIMDDEEVIEQIAGIMFKRIGYELTFARDGAETVRLYEQAMKSGQNFDIVILDLTIPGERGGKETVKRLLEIDAGVKAIVSSGYSEDPVMENYRSYGFKGVLPKPYEVEELSEVIYKVLKEAS
jgi:two-component system cell cycle sensor histidine kinase/response regulator CckA